MHSTFKTGRRLGWVLAGCLFAASLGLVACGDDDDGGGGASGGGENYKMTLIAGVKGDEFYITMNCGAQAEAKKQGVELDFQGPDQFDATLQTPLQNAFFSSVGFGASLALLRIGGPLVLIFFVASTLAAIGQSADSSSAARSNAAWTARCRFGWFPLTAAT